MDVTMPLPPLPAGDVLFEGIPVAAMVLDQLPPVVRDGCVMVRREPGAGMLLIRGGTLVAASWAGYGRRLTGEEALGRMRETAGAVVSAFRLDAGLVEVISHFLLRGERCHEGLSLAWTDWHQLIADLRDRGDAAYLAELRTPGGHGATIIAGGAHVATYADFHPGPGDISLLDGLARQPTGSVSVIRAVAVARAGPSGLHPAVAPSPSEPDPAAPVPLSILLPELKLVARERLHLSADRLERLLDQAAEASRPLDGVLDDIRHLSIRGVLPTTLEELAADMRAVALSRS